MPEIITAIHIDITTEYIEQQSQPDDARFVYAYTITIENRGDQAAQLLRRYWKIVDSNNAVQEVEGVGVIGEQPRLAPGEKYQYTSGVVLATDTGMMEGSYTMLGANGAEFEATIPAFALVKRSALH